MSDRVLFLLMGIGAVWASVYPGLPRWAVSILCMISGAAFMASWKDKGEERK